MLHLPGQWLLKCLRKLLESSVFRRSTRGLLFLWELLVRHVKRSPDKGSRGGLTTPPKTIRLDSAVICASTLPRLPIPGYNISHSQSECHLSSSHRPTHLDPYSLSVSNASRSLQDLRMVRMEAHAPDDLSNNNLSPQVPPDTSSRAPSPTPSHSSNTIPVGSVAASPCISLSSLHPKISPIMPSLFQRYDRNVVIPNNYPYYTIAPLTLSFPRHEISSGWTPFMHPEGALYFYKDEMRVFTDAYLYDNQVLLTVNDIVAQIKDFVRTHNIELTSNVDLVLDFTGNNGDARCGYYFADHDKRLLFWLDQYEICDLLDEIKGAEHPSHIGLEIESQYWYHCELFPSSRDLSLDIVDELRDTIIHASGDSLTSPESTAPFSQDDLDRMLNLINNVRTSVGTHCSGSACLLARYMSNFYHCRFINFYGQNGARLCRDQSVHGDTTTREGSSFLNIISPIFFYTPHVHLKTLAKMSVDQLVTRALWRETVDKFISEWQEFTLYSTVLLNANVAFLTIQSVDDAGSSHYRSPAQLSSYISTVASIGSIILGLLLVRQHRTKADVTFFCNRSVSRFGLETLAILYSIPFALLMWGMASFLVAMSCVCIQTSYRLSQALIGGCEFAIAILVIWCISIGWEKNPYSAPWDFLTWRPWKEAAVSKLWHEKQWNWPSPFRAIRRSSWSTAASSLGDQMTIVEIQLQEAV